MTLAVDASTPAVASAPAGGGAVTTASFTPPAGSLLLALVAVDAGAGGPITDSRGLTWTKRVDASSSANSALTGDSAVIWTAPVSTSAAMTVTAGVAAPTGSVLRVLVLTGAATNSIGKTGALYVNNEIWSTTYTATAVGSLGFALWSDGYGTEPVATAASTGCVVDSSVAYRGSGSSLTSATVRTTSGATSAGRTVTLGVTAPNAGASANVGYLEIVASTAPAAPAGQPIGQSRVPVLTAATR